MTAAGAVLEVAGGTPLRGRVRPPGDKSVSHRALILGALAHGTTEVTGLSPGDDVARTATALRALGAAIEDGPAPAQVRVHAAGREALHPATGPLDVGNSGTSLRLLAGVCAPLPWATTFTGDESLRGRPSRVGPPLRAMGAAVTGTGDDDRPPLVVVGGPLKGIDYDLPVPSAQVKGAVLLAGVAAEGETVVRERVLTRAHTEEMLAAFGADVEVGDGGLTTRVRRSTLSSVPVRVPGDPSQSAFWVVAACITPGSDVVVEGVYVGQARAAFLAVLQRMGADLDVDARPGGTADIRARFGPLRGTGVGGDEVAGLIDEIPVLAVAAAVAEGATTFSGAAELRVKESDRVATVVSELGALGAVVEPRPDGLVVAGGARLGGGRVRAHGDHRIAMAMAVAGLAGTGTVRIEGWDAVATSYPGFEDDLGRLCR
ncbi:MAG: 3-phosphoshikimate 1-carboxyvinyltransferase [Acidimicrobiales bacterium]